MKLSEGRILRAPVPAGMTPQIDISIPATSATWIYKVNTSGSNLHLRSGTGTKYKILGKYKNGSQVIVVKKTSSSWYEVSCPDGKHGYMSATYLKYVKDATSPQKAKEEVIESRQLRDQPFRIYRVVPDLDKVTVYARHIFYDLFDNMIRSYKPSSSATGASVVQGIANACLSEHDFTFYSDMDGTVIVDPSGDDDKETVFENINPVDAFLGSDGFIERFGGELARDWFDVFFVKRVGTESGVQIRQGKNLLGVTYDVDTTDVVTRIMPTGEDKDGELLYLPEVYIDSENIDAYPQPKWSHLAVSDCKENTKASKDNPKKSKSQCYTQMRKAAKAEFDKGCDLPKVTLTVDFISCAETEEYREYAFLQNIYLGDTVRVVAPRIGVSVAMRMTQYTYDCLTRKYTDMVLGTAADTLEGSTISAGQLPSGSITGAKLAINSVGTGQLQSASVGSLQVQMAAIQTAHIEDAAITHAKIGEAAIGQANIQQAAIGTAQIADAAITTAKIAEAAVGSAQIEEASIDTAHIKDAAVGTAQIEDAAITSAKIGEGEIQTAHIEDAAITHAKIGEAAVGSANIENAAIGTTKIADAAITNAKIGGAAVGTANIQDASISTAKIIDSAITRAKIAELAVGSAEIDNLAVTTAKIAQAAITSAKIANAAVDTAQIALGAITSALISQGAVGTAQIADASITDAKIVSLNADVITSGTLATERLIIKGTDGVIYEINAQSGGLTSAQLTDEKYKQKLNGSVLVARSVTADQIAAATITANEILAGTITGYKIAAATIEGSNIKAGTITTSHVSSDFGKTLDLSSNTGINMRVEQINSDIEDVRSAAVAEVLVQYALSSSASVAPATGWQTDAPAWQDGKFMWQRTVTTYADGESEVSAATCLTGATGAAGEAATTLRIESSRGTVFKRDDVSTVLSAVIYNGSQRITDITALRAKFGSTAYLQWKWRRRDDSGYGTISASDSRITNGGFSFTVTAADVDANVTFLCELITD